MAGFLRICQWEKYQHYRDRNPPWIKLHQELVTSITWTLADNASRVLAIALMMLAAKTGNNIPADPEYVKRVTYLHEVPDFSQLLHLGFIEIVPSKLKKTRKVNASNMLADASKVLTNARPETETETEEENKNLSSNSCLKDSVFDKAYEQYPRHVGKTVAKKAWGKAAKEQAGKLESLSDAEQMLYQRVMTFAAVCKRVGKEKQFTPHMATWLNQGRFLDDPSEWAVTDRTRIGATETNGEYKTPDALEEIEKRRAEKRAKEAQEHPNG